MQSTLPPTELIDQFRTIRPILETGYEAILLMRLLYQGEDEQDIFENYSNKTRQALIESGKEIDFLKQLFGETRDIWIKRDLNEWVDMNPLFPGVADKLRKLEQQAYWYIVTTKQERFVTQILQANGINLANDRIFGLGRNINKVEVLTELLAKHSQAEIYFIEDRLPTLVNVLGAKWLESIKLFLADWGYNTKQDIESAQSKSIKIIGIEGFLV
jgi:phosphoglycolate phosphatase-like HAD superfamily hydrolase